MEQKENPYSPVFNALDAEGKLRAKAEVYIEWRESLPDERRQYLLRCEKRLIESTRGMGELSAKSLLFDLLFFTNGGIIKPSARTKK